MSSSNSSNAPRGAAAQRTPRNVEEPSTDFVSALASASAPDLYPPPAVSAAASVGIGLEIENPPSNDDAPISPAQIGVAYGDMEETIKESIKNHPVDNEASLPPTQIAALHDNINRTIKESINNSDDDVPLPPSQISLIAGGDEINAKEKAEQSIEGNDDVPSMPAATPPLEAESIHQASSPSTVPPVLSAPPINHSQSLSNARGQQQQIPTIASPQSTQQNPHENLDTPSVSVSASQRESSVSALVLEGELVEDPPDIPIYDGVQVQPRTWRKKYQKYLCGGIGLLAGLGVAGGVSLYSNSSANGNSKERTDSTASASSTNQPSLSLSPSQSLIPSESFYPSQTQVPSMPPTLGPTKSSLPSQVPSLRPTLRPSKSLTPSAISLHPTMSAFPSQIPSLRPSFQPSVSSPPSTFWSSLNWEQQDQCINGTSGDFLGGSVAFSADGMTMAVGAPGNWYENGRTGYVKVYHREGEGSSWEQQGETIYGDTDGDKFGWSLSLSGDGRTLSIGAPRNFSEGKDSGQIKIFEWDEAVLDYQQLGDTLYGDGAGHRFGYSVALSLDGKTLAVGANSYQFPVDEPKGQVKVFVLNETASIYKQQGQTINGDVTYELYPHSDDFGHSVSLSGDGKTLAIGAPFGDSYSTYHKRDSGQVKVFSWDEASLNYVQLGDSIVGDAAGDYFGWSVSISNDGKALAIGTIRGDNENNDYFGQVKIFGFDEAALNFKQLGKSLYGDSTDKWDNFGISVALSSDGKTLAIGARQFSSKTGYTEVYGWDEDALDYKQLGHRINGEAAAGDFGYTVALSADGKVLAVAAPLYKQNGVQAGQLKVFNLEL